MPSEEKSGLVIAFFSFFLLCVCYFGFFWGEVGWCWFWFCQTFSIVLEKMMNDTGKIVPNNGLQMYH